MRFLIVAAALTMANAATAQTTLTASLVVRAPGTSTTATWSGLASPSSVWIGLFTPTAGDGGYSSWMSGTNTSSGSVSFAIPSSTAHGTYELRIFSGGVKRATSNPIIVSMMVSGPITFGGSGLTGVSISATNGANCPELSNFQGHYACAIPSGWSGTVTPSKAGYVFTPDSRSYTNVTTNQTAQSYAAFTPLELSGTVSWNSSPLAGVAFSASNGGSCTTSDGSGQYTCAVPPGWTGEVTPSLANYVFSPASRSYASVSANQSAQDYAATVLRHVSGTARVNGLPVANVAFAATSGGSCTAANSAGQYSCTVPDGWTGSVTPSHMGYSFTPASRNYTSIAADAPAEDYTATPSSPASNISFVHVDHLNTPRLITNDQGQTVWRWDQAEPFGVNVADENPSGLGAYEMPLRFPGQYFDKETNLHYSYFREYDASMGRFPQFDPIGLRGGPNGYAYVDSNPLSRIDPFGLAAQSSAGGEKMADCGPEGGWLERFIPNNPRGYPFQRCCDAHDKCYDRCFGSDKLTCDTDACGCFKQACSGTSGSAQTTCLRIAQEYCYRILYSETADEQFRKARAKCKSASACIPSSTL
jgi:RHS repeat-associated protein